MSNIFSFFRYLRPKWRDQAFLLILAALVPVGATACFVALAEEIHEGETQVIDRRILLAMREPDNPADLRGPPWLEEMGRDMTALGSTVVVVLITATVGGGLALKRNYGALFFMLAAVGGGQLLSSGLKHAFGRPRPDLVPHAVQVYTASFPSGHSMLAAVVYLTLAALLARLTTSAVLRLYMVATAMAVTVLVGLSRIYLGVHYPTDVLGGWVAGLAWAAACWVAAVYLQQRGLVEKSGGAAASS